MTAIPAAGYFIDTLRTNNEARVAQDDMLAVFREGFGGKVRTELTISTGAIVPTGSSHTVDSASGPDDLDNITTTNTPDGRLLLIQLEDAARVVTVRDQQSGAGQIHTIDGNDVVLTTINHGMLLERFGTDWYERIRFPGLADGLVFINESTNVDMTLGLTINQAANTDEAFAIKSSSFSHTFTDFSEVDTYLDILKGTGGVPIIRGFSTVGAGIEIEGMADATDIVDTDTTADIGVINLSAYEDTGTGRQAVTTGNIFAVLNGTTTRMLLKEDGELHIGNTTLAILSDDKNDVELLRAFDHHQAAMGAKGFIRSEWDDFVSYNKDDLIAAGILGKTKEDGTEGLWNVSQHIKLLNGAILQSHIRQKELEQRLELAEGKLKLIAVN